MTEPAPAPPQASTEKAGLVEDFVDIFIAPAQVFARRATASPALPFIIASVLLVAFFFINKNVTATIFDAEMQKGMEQAMKSNPRFTPDQLAQSRPIMETTVMISAVVGVPVVLLVLGLVTWGVGRMMGGTLSFGTGLTIAAYSWIPRVLESVLVSVQGLVLDTSKFTSRSQLSLGVGRFLDPESTSLSVLALLSRVDLITLWVTVLLGVGLVAAAKVPKQKAIAGAALLWVLGGLPAIWTAMRG